MRTIASQMKDAEGRSSPCRSTPRPSSARGVHLLRSPPGRTITFHGFLKAYVESIDDADGRRRRARPGSRNLTQGQSLRPE